MIDGTKLASLPMPSRPDQAPAADPPAESIEAAEGEIIMFRFTMPTGRDAVVGLPAGCAPGEALYVVSQINALAGRAFAAAPAAGPGGRRKPRLWVPG